METPYGSSEFTKMSEKDMESCKEESEHPLWNGGFSFTLQEYYDLHEETPLSHNLGYLASSVMGVIVHGHLNQEKLATHLQHFDIRKLLREGPSSHDLLSQEAQHLLYSSLMLPRILDVHLHGFGFDEGNYLDPLLSSQKKASYKNYAAFTAVRYACGITSAIGSTHAARLRLHLYAAHFPRLHGYLLPIHPAFLPDGTTDWERTALFLNNSSTWRTAISFDNYHGDSRLVAGVSIHPFDPQWKEKLHEAHAKGIRLVKWMPPQSIPPHSSQIDDYYKTLADLKMTLLAHAGIEHVIPTRENTQEWREWGNPLHFRKPLEIGVSLILAHCGHKDLLTDLDNPHTSKKPGVELFLRLAREAHQKNKTGEWPGRLYGDLAAVTTHYGPEFIKELLLIANEEGIRLLYGTDYPYTNLIQPQHDAYELCAAAGLLPPSYTQPLKEIRAWNPLLANYVFTQHLSAQGSAFPEATFTGVFPEAPLHLI